MSFTYNHDKNKQLIAERGISFEQIIDYIKSDALIYIQQNTLKYHHQQIYVLNINNYIWIVPFVESSRDVFLKTAFPSRKFTKQYLGE
jgi:uncharacterized DUF497 family protein